MNVVSWWVAVIVVVAAAVACRSTPPVTVTITSPEAGDTVKGTAVHVTLDVSGVELAPASEQRPGTAHHHLFLDVDPGSLESPIPVGMPGIIHLGNAQTAFHWDSVAPGEHLVIAILGDPNHAPLRPLVADTVAFVVVAP